MPGLSIEEMNKMLRLIQAGEKTIDDIGSQHRAQFLAYAKRNPPRPTRGKDPQMHNARSVQWGGRLASSAALSASHPPPPLPTETMTATVDEVGSQAAESRVCVIDNGIFVELAIRLARDLREVGYWSPFKSGFPKSSPALIGVGYPGVVRVNELFDHIDDYDTFVFPDIYHADLQKHLESLGKKVWGGHEAEWLELDRMELRRWCKSVGLPVADHHELIGLDSLRAYLRSHENVWVKVSYWRGDFETYHHTTHLGTLPWLDDLARRLGARQHTEKFMVEADIPGIEIGYDGYSVRGEYPKYALYGYEFKDKCYLGRVVPYSQLPGPLRMVNEKLTPVLQKGDHRGFISTELRITEAGKVYLTDPCIRRGSPPGEVMDELFAGWREAIPAGADGRLESVTPVAQFGALLMLHSQWADKNWMPIDIPKSDRRFVKLRNATLINSQEYVVPTEVGLPEIGAVIGLGDTMEEAIQDVDERSHRLVGYQLEVYDDAFDEAMETIEKGKKVGITW